VIDERFVIVGALIGSVGMVLYLRDTLRGDTQPNRVTFLLWAIAPLLAFGAEISAGVGLRSLMTFVVGFFPLLIFLASFRSPGAVWELQRIDYVCGALSVVGLLAWIITQHGTVAIVAAIASDALAATPTVRKAWLQPETETAAAYAAAGINAFITLLTVTEWTTADVAFPLYILCGSVLMTTLVAGRLGPRVRGQRHERGETPAHAG
jgi:cytosine/uracil/thiamine/allantoin permease